MNKRDAGWYWVKDAGQWEPLWFNGVMWDGQHWDSDIQEIGPRIPTPGEPGQRSQHLLDECYGTIGLLTIEKSDIQQEALDLAKDVDWFVRMQASADPGMKQMVLKAKAFIEKHDQKAEGGR